MLKIKKLLFLTIVLLLGSCNNQPKKATSDVEKEENKAKLTEAKFGRNNYAVVWKWKTSDKDLFEKHMLTVSKEMEKLWKDDVIVDSYFNSVTNPEDMKVFPNISCFIKAKTEEEARGIIDELTLVKLALAEYTIFPVGTKWLGRNTDKIHERGVKRSYVTVWTTLKELKLGDELIKKNSDAILKLWNDGVVENVYFDIEGTQTASNKKDFVFFINADSKEEAKSILDRLPFVTSEIASYKMYPVGVFWLGEFTKK